MNSEVPKVLQPLAGEPLLQHVIRTARLLQPANIYVVYGHGGAQVQAALAHEHVDWILQADQLGTGHAVMQAMCVVPDDHTVLVLYGDVPMIRAPTLKKLLALADDGALAVLSVNLDDATGYGRIVRDSAGRVSAIVEQREASAEQLQIRELNTGLMAAPARRLREWLLGLGSNNTQREYYLTDVVAAAVQGGGPVEVLRVANVAEVLGVNDKLQLARVESCYRREKAQEMLVAGATLADPDRVDARGEVLVGRDVFIDINVVFIGKVELAAGVRIGPNCTISNSSIGAHSEILANCVLDRAVVGQRCRVGPFAHLRPGALLHDEVHVGNFVEVKNTKIGAGSKANHLTYLGDAAVGSGVNVGAGTITCNYDGENKWPTVIEDGAFIGSGSMLVAPVRIGAGATIGAGSAITENAPGGQLTLTRAKQIAAPSWTRPAKFGEEQKAAIIDRALGPKPKS